MGNDGNAVLGGLVQPTMRMEGMIGSYFSARKRCFLTHEIVAFLMVSIDGGDKSRRLCAKRIPLNPTAPQDALFADWGD